MSITKTETLILKQKIADQIKDLEKDLKDPSKFKTRDDWKNVVTIKEGDDSANRNE